jgi:hypothetical protein
VEERERERGNGNRKRESENNSFKLQVEREVFSKEKRQHNQAEEMRKKLRRPASMRRKRRALLQTPGLLPLQQPPHKAKIERDEVHFMGTEFSLFTLVRIDEGERERERPNVFFRQTNWENI